MISDTYFVEITNLEIDPHYYSFYYTIHKNGELFAQSEFSSDHVWSDDIQGFRKILEGGEASKLALEEAL